MIELKWLDGDEMCAKLNPMLEEQGWTLLNPRTCRALVAFDDEKIVAYFCLQLFPVLGPQFVEPLRRNGVLSAALVDGMKEFLNETEARGWMVVADNKATEKMCIREGMKKLESPVFIS